MIEKIRGIVLPLPTVFLKDGRVDEDLMRELTEFYIGAGVHSLFVLGSYGQGPALSPEERRRVAEIVVRQTDHRVPCIVHVGSVDPFTAIDLGRHARSIGADAIGHVGPYYYADRSEYEVLEHLRMVDGAVGLPLLIYNNPRYSGYNMAPSMMAKLVQAIPNIFGAKLAMGSVDEAMAYLKAAGEKFATFALASNLVPGMSVGIRGTISPPLSATPEIGVALVRAIDSGRAEEQLALQKQVIKIHDLFLRLAIPFGRTIYREALRLRGFKVKMYPRWPSRPLTKEAQAELEELFAFLGVTEAPGRVKSA
jgi:dihydrodipicolinate synthase/N-acetylneuraminate lyase